MRVSFGPRVGSCITVNNLPTTSRLGRRSHVSDMAEPYSWTSFVTSCANNSEDGLTPAGPLSTIPALGPCAPCLPAGAGSYLRVRSLRPEGFPPPQCEFCDARSGRVPARTACADRSHRPPVPDFSALRPTPRALNDVLDVLSRRPSPWRVTHRTLVAWSRRHVSDRAELCSEVGKQLLWSCPDCHGDL